MLTSLGLQNFKAWKEIRNMRLAPITGLFGANSSGKTSILQLLLLLKQTTECADRQQVLDLGGERSLLTLGSFEELIYQHDTELALSWSLNWIQPAQELRVQDPEQPERLLFNGKDFGFSASVGQHGGQITLEQFAYRFSGHDFRLQRGAADRYELSASPQDFQFKRIAGRPWDLRDPIKCYGFPDAARAYFTNTGILSDLQLAFEELFKRVYYLGPLREDPRRAYAWGGSAPAEVGRRGERTIEALLANRQKGDRIGRGRGRGRRALSLEETVGWWLQELGLIYRFAVEEVAPDAGLYRVRVQESASSAPVLITDVGFGVSQLLPVLTLCYYAPEGSTIILEQPEIHLHPSVQARLADVFIDAVKRRGVQILLESHSEHLLLRLQRRIAECYRVPGHSDPLTEQDVALYFCGMIGGTSRLTPLEIDQYGNIRNWPEHFFGDQFGETAAMMDAAIHRKKREAA